VSQQPATTAVPEPSAILEGLREALTVVLDKADLAKVDLSAIDTRTPLLSLPLDSMALLEMVTRIENQFRVYIPAERAYEFVTVGEAVDFVRERAAAKATRRKA